LDYLSSNDVSDDDAFDCRLVSCELITNVVRHCGESALFKGVLYDDRIEITVLSKNTKKVNLAPSLPSVFAESGRGLYIINAICNGDVKDVKNGIKVCIKRNTHSK
jgi:anti-sigma regulatory factor (Ser/Thr protein kinase)